MSDEYIAVALIVVISVVVIIWNLSTLSAAFYDTNIGNHNFTEAVDSLTE